MFGKAPGKRKLNSRSSPTSRRRLKKRLEKASTQFRDHTLVFTVYDDASFDVHIASNPKICLKDQYDREIAVGSLVLEHSDFFKVKSIQKAGKKKVKPKQVNTPAKKKAVKQVKPKKFTKTEIAQKKKEEKEKIKWALMQDILELFQSSCYLNYEKTLRQRIYTNRDFAQGHESWEDFEKHMSWAETLLLEELEQAQITKRNKKKYTTLAKQYAETFNCY